MSRDHFYTTRWTQCGGTCSKHIPPDTEAGFLPTPEGDTIACTNCLDTSQKAKANA